MLHIALWAAIFLPGAFAPGQRLDAAGRHALLIGIGRYPALSAAKQLEGPRYDVEALEQALIDSWKVPPENIATLVDSQATKRGILEALQRLVRTTQAGDSILLYFSGHGTSPFDQGAQHLQMSPHTGALVPADVRLGPDPAAVLASLVVGRNDLRPLLLKLEQRRHILAIFDACYSGNSVRSLQSLGRAKDLELVLPSSRPAPQDESGSASESGYPYSNTVYLSASSNRERAYEVTSQSLSQGFRKTVDGKPHGALTNALLAAMSGRADLDGDQTVNYGELYQFVREKVQAEFPQTPQILAPVPARDLSMPVLGMRRPLAGASASQAPRQRTVRVRLQSVSNEIRRRILGLSGVQVIRRGRHDLLLLQGDGRLWLFHASGDEIISRPLAFRGEVIRRIQAEASIQRLLGLSDPRSDFGVRLEVQSAQRQGVLTGGEWVTIRFASSKASRLLLLNIDRLGHISVLYPSQGGETASRPGGQWVEIRDVLVQPPYGVEFLKLVAFSRQPHGWEQWQAARLRPGGPEFDQLVQMIESSRPDIAQAWLKLVSRDLEADARQRRPAGR